MTDICIRTTYPVILIIAKHRIQGIIDIADVGPSPVVVGGTYQPKSRTVFIISRETGLIIGVVIGFECSVSPLVV